LLFIRVITQTQIGDDASSFLEMERCQHDDGVLSRKSFNGLAPDNGYGASKGNYLHFGRLRDQFKIVAARRVAEKIIILAMLFNC
jgi:hypothetical protein